MKTILLNLVLLSACAKQDDYPIGPQGGIDSGPHAGCADASCPAPQACITNATLTGTLLVVDLDASVGKATLMAMDLASSSVVGAPVEVSTTRGAITLPSGSGTTPLVAVAVSDAGRACQAPIAVN